MNQNQFATGLGYVANTNVLYSKLPLISDNDWSTQLLQTLPPSSFCFDQILHHYYSAKTRAHLRLQFGKKPIFELIDQLISQSSSLQQQYLIDLAHSYNLLDPSEPDSISDFELLIDQLDIIASIRHFKQLDWVIKQHCLFLIQLHNLKSEIRGYNSFITQDQSLLTDINHLTYWFISPKNYQLEQMLYPRLIEHLQKDSDDTEIIQALITHLKHLEFTNHPQIIILSTFIQYHYRPFLIDQ